MTARFEDRIRRLDTLLSRIPSGSSRPTDHYPDARTLLCRLEHTYASSQAGARLRMLQRDLDELVRRQQVVIVNPTSKPFRYRRVSEASEDALAVEFTIRQLQAACSDLIPEAPLNTVLERFAGPPADSPLPMERIRVLPEGQRLLAASVRPEVMSAVLEALVRGNTLSITYRDAAGKRTRPQVHPQALVQRGPRIYLYALKGDEDQPVRQYALHRMIRAEVGARAARVASGFDIDDSIRSGVADFASGECVALCLRARGYVAGLLHDCALGPGQRIEDEAEDSDFEIRVSVVVPNTGQLLRWLLGCGDKIEVIAPVELRRVVGAQAMKAAQLYMQDRAD
ncbi:MAG TPA: WYL domain-containing protein [Azoarcus taiwanensis]|nr:WYL domain-containing protein [Azoarcus taiwanensis]